MKSSTHPPNSPTQLPESTLHRLNMYALAASTAGVSLVALSTPSAAKVIYTPAHKWLPINRYFYLDLNHDGVKDFELFLNSVPGTLTAAVSFKVTGLSQSRNGIYSAISQGSRWAAALPEGRRVKPFAGARSAGWLNRASMFWSTHNTNFGSSRGPWRKVTGQAYLGLRFTIRGKIHYGWARIGNISYGPRKRPKALLTGYAYETIPDKPIITGNSKGPDAAAQPGSLGSLALGKK
jgi:hypothetical protein